jgi:hypothetical protein
MRLVIALDTMERGENVFLNATLYDDDGATVDGLDVELRDYGRGDTKDEDGNLYLPMSETKGAA